MENTTNNNQKKIGTLTEESLKRKERLKRLRNLVEQSENSSSESTELPKPIFRSYKPQDENLSDTILEQGPTGEIEKEVESQLELLKTPNVIDEIDIANLAPRKPDWDLKRDVAKKLEKLERRTQKAIAELIRERLKKNLDLSQVVNVGAAIEAKESEQMLTN
ncbi:coiled-coil domain-containing protein 12 [Episyrphus balteatus]|uniref:coiled-coil domain-containing protein 12 n=1 Tax=Episyrphus balteatus TaxID=286459 RepID=UPI00248640CF|nr:coiled-coil domain-containing protein 12 [Episyrphus balteatus]